MQIMKLISAFALFKLFYYMNMFFAASCLAGMSWYWQSADVV